MSAFDLRRPLGVSAGAVVLSLYMRLLLAAVLLVAAAAPALSQQAEAARRPASVRGTATVWGQVRSEKTGAPLRFAVIEMISSDPESLMAITDSTGLYTLRNVPAGRRMLRVTHIDHAPNEVEILIVADKQHPIDFDLEFRPIRMIPVTARGARALPVSLDTVPATQQQLGKASARVIEATPGVAELGLPDAARDVPGYEPIDPADVLYVRGGSADMKFVMLNGAPVYAPFHIGGLINALDSDVLHSAELYIGGAPARFDGGLSYIMDLESRSGRNQALHGVVGLDMLSARTLLEGPIGDRVSFLVSARGVHGLGTEAVQREAFPYGYGDALSRVDLRVADAHFISLTGFWNHESVQLDTAGSARESASWGNRAGSLRYHGTVGTSDVLTTLALGRFRTLLPLGGIQPLISEGTAERMRLALDVNRPIGGAQLFWGGSVDRLSFEYRAFNQDVDRDQTIVRAVSDGDIYGAYGEAAVTVLPRVRLRGGLRADIFSRDPTPRISPRLSATMLLTSRATITLSGGQFRQYIRAPERSIVFLASAVPDSGAGPPLTVAESSHLVLSLSQDFGEGIGLGLDGFFKEFEGLKPSRKTRTQSSGVDLWLRRNGGNLNGWLGYSLGWIWTIQNTAAQTTADFNGRHLVTGGLLGSFLGSDFDVRVAYGAGLPFTAIPEPEISASPVFSLVRDGGGSGAGARFEDPVRPTEPQEPYIRVDAQLSRSFEGIVRDRSFSFRPYIRVINALNRRDAIFYHYNRDVGRSEPLADLPIVPILGLEWKF